MKVSLIFFIIFTYVFLTIISYNKGYIKGIEFARNELNKKIKEINNGDKKSNA